MKINDTQFNCDLEDVIVELQAQLRLNGIQLLQKTKDTADNIMVQCPYHADGQERRPSAGIRKSDGTFHCFACNETHDLQEVVSYCFGKEDGGLFGWQWLLKNFVTVSINARTSIDLDFSRNIKRKDESNIKYVLEEELSNYRYFHPYMYKRKLTDEVIEIFDLGYDAATQSITFPIKDIDGNCLFVARRSVKTKWFNYPAGAEKPLYGLHELHQLQKFPDEVIVCESMLDALSCWVYGKYAVALNGLGNDLQFKQLRELPCRKLILATDNDKAGMDARKRIRRNVKNKLITEYLLPDGKKDINDLSKEEFEKLQEVF